MGKETIICIIIVIAIVIGNIVTQNYTIDSVKELSDGLTELKTELENQEDDISRGNVKDKIQKIEDNWKGRHEKLAYYIEHDELEKVETNITALKSFIVTNEYAEAVSELDKSVFVLKHIEDKYAFNLQNVF